METRPPALSGETSVPTILQSRWGARPNSRQATRRACDLLSGNPHPASAGLGFSMTMGSPKYAPVLVI